jgi:hypothetical protein
MAMISAAAKSRPNLAIGKNDEFVVNVISKLKFLELGG